MNTIKFESWDSVYPLHKGTNQECHAKQTSLMEAKNIWHRAFQINNTIEYKEWKEGVGWGAIHTSCQVVGECPDEALRRMEKAKNKNRSVHFEYLTFWDSDGELNKVILFCANAYIMNQDGQTVDSFAA